MKNSNQPLQQRENKPKREPIPKTWFLSHGFTLADKRYTNDHDIWLHPKTNDVFSAYGKIKLNLLPNDKHKKTSVRYLRVPKGYGSILLARLKYLTFKGEIKKGETIDHIDGNPLNNDISNLRAVTRAINSRDGGFLKKLRNHGIIVTMFPGKIILQGFERMAQWKDSHTRWQYQQLTRNKLLQIFIGTEFTVTDPDILMDRDISTHCEI